jgi:hypothetical protein
LTSVQIKAALHECARESAHSSAGLVECGRGFIWVDGKIDCRIAWQIWILEAWFLLGKDWKTNMVKGFRTFFGNVLVTYDIPWEAEVERRTRGQQKLRRSVPSIHTC